MDREDLRKLRYKEVHRIAKTHGIRAKGKQEVLINALLKKFHGGPVPIEAEPEVGEAEVALEVRAQVVEDTQNTEDPPEALRNTNLEPKPESRAEHPEEPEKEYEPVVIPSPQSMARIVSAIRPTMFPLPSSPVGRLQPANFAVNSRFVPASPWTDSSDSSSAYGSPNPRRIVPGAYSPRPAVVSPNREFDDDDSSSIYTGDAQSFEFPSDWEPNWRAWIGFSASGAGNPLCKAQPWDPEIIRPSVRELQSLLERADHAAADSVAVLPEIDNLRKMLRLAQIREQQAMDKLRKVKTLREVLRKYYFGEGNLARLADGVRNVPEGERIAGTTKRRNAGVHADESPNKRRRTAAA